MRTTVGPLLAALIVASTPAASFASPSAAPAAAAAGGKIALTTSVEEARAAFVRGRDLVERLRPAEATEHYRRAVELDPSFALAHLNLAGTLATPKEFFAELAQAVELAPRASAGERLMIDAARAGADGDNARQVQLLERLVAQFPGDERAHNLLGNAHFGVQRWKESIPHFERALAIAPDFSQPYNQLGYAYRFLGDTAKAEETFRRYVEVLPGDPNPSDSYAELLLQLGRYDEAIASYRKALAADPAFLNSHLGIATCLDLSGRGGEARRELDTALAAAKNDGQVRAVLFARTVSHLHEGDFTAAYRTVDEQYALGEKTGDVASMAGDLILRGNLQLEQNDSIAARESFAKAMALVEGSSLGEAQKANARRFSQFNQGRVALSRGDLAGARTQAASLAREAAKAGNPFQVRLAHQLHGMIALRAGQWNRAIDELGQANRLDPYNQYRLSLAYRGKGDAAKSQELANAAAQANGLTSLNHAFVRSRLSRQKVAA